MTHNSKKLPTRLRRNGELFHISTGLFHCTQCKEAKKVNKRKFRINKDLKISLVVGVGKVNDPYYFRDDYTCENKNETCDDDNPCNDGSCIDGICTDATCTLAHDYQELLQVNYFNLVNSNLNLRR